jgi:bifunctional non-homologous end joining protein LigD
VRCPDGVGKQCFYQRHLLMGASPGELKTVRREKKGGKSAYIYADSMDAVISAVQNGAVEFHTWGSTVPDIHHPDRITIDLDPGPDVSWKTLVGATRLTKTLLDGLRLQSFLKTTGGKGLHIVVPIEPRLSWDEVKDFSRRIAEFLVRAERGLFVATMTKSRREGKVFVDYLRNSETASAVAAFSARARPGATVSMPLAWEELGDEDLRARFTIRTIQKRLGEDPWRAYWRTRQSITPQMLTALR